MAKKIVGTFISDDGKFLMKRMSDGSVAVMRQLAGRTSVQDKATGATTPIKRGQRGKAGVSVVGAKIKGNKLIIKLSDGKVINAGAVVPDDLSQISPVTGEFMTRSEANNLVEEIKEQVRGEIQEMDISGEEIARRLEDIEFEDDRLDYNSLKNLPNIKKLIVSTGHSSGGGGGGVINTASNGLNVVGTDVQLGGLLTDDIVIDGDSQSYSMTFQGMDNFEWQEGTDWTVGGAGIGVQNINLTAVGELTMACNSFLRLKTPAIFAASATNGQVFTLQNAVTGEGEWASISGLGVTNGLQDIGGLHGLGGNMTQATNISGSGFVQMSWTSFNQYIISSQTSRIERNDGSSYTSFNNSGATSGIGKSGSEIIYKAGAEEATLGAYGNVGNTQPIARVQYTDGVSNTSIIEVDEDGIQIEASTGAKLFIKDGTTATNGQVLTLIDNSTGESQFTDAASGLPVASVAGQVAMYDGANYVVATPEKDKFTSTSGVSVVLSSTPLVSTDNVIDVYKNGLLMEEGATNDYTVTGATVSFTLALVPSDKVTVKYYS